MGAASVPGHCGNSVLKFGDCELHVLTHEFWRKGQKLPIPQRVFDLIVHLIQHRPSPVAQADLAKAVWGRSDVRPSQMAQAIMQARQLTGDDGPEPACFVSVRGVGYRFAAAVTEGAQATPAGVQDTELATFHATFADAEKALEARDTERAQFLADRALALATAAGVNRERSRALSLAALTALQRGTLETAAGLAMQALQVAELEGHLQAAAQARVRLAHVRHMAGDVQGSLRQLRAAYGLLDAPEMQRDRQRCEGLLALVHRDLGEFDQALTWCARALDTARQQDAESPHFLERTLAVDFHLAKAEALAEQGQAEPAQATYQQALALNLALAPDLAAHHAPSHLLCWHGNQALALASLGRLPEAWQKADDLEQALAAWPAKAGPHFLVWELRFKMVRAGLLADSRRFEEALELIQQALAAARQAGLLSETSMLLARAAKVCEQAGRYKQALDWLRQRHAAQAALQSHRAATLASVMQAEVQADTLRRDLQAAREQAQQLALENRSLVQRLHFLEHAQLRDDAGFTDPLFLRSTLAPRHTDARQRDVPFCLALLSIDNFEGLVQQLEPAALNTLLRELARHLADTLTPGQQVVRWRGGLLVFALENMGERRALAICQGLARQLDAVVWPGRQADPGGLKPRFSIRCIDAGQHDTLDLALERLLQPGQPGLRQGAGSR